MTTITKRSRRSATTMRSVSSHSSSTEPHRCRTRPSCAPWTAGLREVIIGNTELAAAESGNQPEASGDLAKNAPCCSASPPLAPSWCPVITQATGLADDGTRFDPATLAVGAIVVLALQTEVKTHPQHAGEMVLHYPQAGDA